MFFKNRPLSSLFVGGSLGLMSGASWHSYHSRTAALIAGTLMVLAFITADFSGPRDPK